METIKPEKIITTISNLKTGEVYKTEDEWRAKGVPEAEIRRDVQVIMPSLDLFPKTKQCGKMSIIRSNIARQLLAEGGAPRKPFANGGFDYESAAAFGNDMGMTSSPSSSSTTGFEGSPEMTGQGTTTEETYGGPVGDNEPSFFQKAKDRFKTFETDSRMNRIGRGVLTTPGAIKSVFGLRDVPPELLATLADDYTQGGLFSEGLVGGDISLSNAASTLKGLEDLGVDLTEDIRPQVADISRSKFAERFGPKTKGGEGGDNEPIKKLRAPIAEKKEEPKGEFDDILKFYGARFEDGGDVRQEYGLGSIVKKIGKTVKKVVKSPVGKAALTFAAYKYGPGFLSGKGLGMGKATSFKDLIFMGKDANVNPFRLIGIPTLLSGLLTKDPKDETILSDEEQSDPEFQKFLSFYGGPTRFAADGGDIEDAPMKTASMPSTFGELNQLSIDLFGRPYDQLNDSEQEILIEYFTKGKKQGVERATAAMGGMMEKDEMLNLGGNEMDLRGGGFVPLGEYEKKDDVPARLSKNEFVFTADAVRAAGGGSVDRGADIMYKTMKTLENKVA